MILAGKTVIITGVGPGMGRAMALGAAREGAKVALAARSQDFLASVLAEVRAAGGEAISVRADVASSGDCENLAAQTLEAFGRIDGVVNSAYFHPPWLRVEEADLNDYLRAFDVGCLGAVRMARAVLPAMKSQGGGSIVNVSTLATRKPMVGEGGYAMAKAAMGQATRQLAVELGVYGVRVNQVLMGWMMGTPLQGAFESIAANGGQSVAEQKAAVIARIPLGRITPDQECAKAVYFMLSDYSSELTGAALDVNGGEWVSP
jgi:NAD(P)-dependent dehydrogenase (short-subunit alcohol dehydrogenase family)